MYSFEDEKDLILIYIFPILLCREIGAEYGTTTGRPRRCGWLDIPQLRYSCLVNGFTSLNLTKLDVLDEFDEIQIGVRYMHKGVELITMPSSLKVGALHVLRGGGVFADHLRTNRFDLYKLLIWLFCILIIPYFWQVLSELEVEYETVPGWRSSIAKCRNFEDLPPQAQAYVRRIEELTGVPVRWIGVGPGRLDVIDRGDQYALKA